MATNTGFKGIDVRQTGNELVFDALLTSSGSAYASGTVTLSILQLMSDGSIQTYDFNTNTFTAGTVTTLTEAMIQRTFNNGGSNSGIWTYALSTLNGFTIGAIYFAYVLASGSDTPVQVHKFQYGGDQGDLQVTQTGSGTAVIQSNATVAIPVAIAQASQTPGQITCLRGDTLSVALPVMGNISSRTKMILTAKMSVNDPDEQAIIQIVEETGLVIFNGTSPSSASGASLTVTDAATGAVDLVIDADVTCLLAVEDLAWDVQVYLATGIVTPICGTFSVVADVTRTVT